MMHCHFIMWGDIFLWLKLYVMWTVSAALKNTGDVFYNHSHRGHMVSDRFYDHI